MKPSYNWTEWVRKAEIDFRATQRAIKDSLQDPEQAEVACFHAQQCVEKYLKAILASLGIRPPKIHDLARLITEIKKEGIDLTRLEEDAFILNSYAIDTRYPGSCATPVEGRRAVKKMEKAAQACKKVLAKAP